MEVINGIPFGRFIPNHWSVGGFCFYLDWFYSGKHLGGVGMYSGSNFVVGFVVVLIIIGLFTAAAAKDAFDGYAAGLKAKVAITQEVQ